jgi:hypothetical protein
MRILFEVLPNAVIQPSPDALSEGGMFERSFLPDFISLIQ